MYTKKFYEIDSCLETNLLQEFFFIILSHKFGACLNKGAKIGVRMRTKLGKEFGTR
jgi:hypothetical protein